MSFENIKYQDRAIDLLKGYIRHGRIASSYLFSGPEGVGKHLAAVNFAKALNCDNLKDDACGSCGSCLKIDKKQHPDVHFFGVQEEEEDSAHSIKIEDIRSLQKDISLRPYEAKYKIFIIDNAHQLTPEAANALLKTLEEAPAQSVIILVTHKSPLLFKTIISRCQILKFYPLPRLELSGILEKEYAFDRGQAHFIAFLSEGRLGNALRLKDRDILRERNKIIDDIVLSKNKTTDEYCVAGKEKLRFYLNLISTWFRDIYLLKAGVSIAAIINSDRSDELAKAAQRYSFMDLDRIFATISDALMYIDRNINTRLVLSHLNLALKGKN